MRRTHPSTGSASGFTLIETMAALFVFTIMTLGIIPLLTSSIRGAALSRSYTVGKNVAVEAMERARDLPYYIAYSSQNSKVDVLDAYFPSASGGGYTAGSGQNPPQQGDYKYTTVCTTSTPSGTACVAGGLPDGYTMTFEAQFVNATNTDPETYVPAPPGASYAWNSADNDEPASQLLRISVVAEWTQSGDPESFRLTSIVGDRKFAVAHSLRGTGRVDFGVRVLTAYTSSGTDKDLSVVGGNAGSGVESETASTADQTVVAGEIRSLPSTLPPMRGATSVHHAPPDSTPAGVSAGAVTFSDAGGTPSDRAYLNSTSTSGLQVGVSGQLPRAEGALTLTSSGANTGYNTLVSSTSDELWVDNTVSTAPPVNGLHLDSTKSLLTVRPFDPGTGTVSLSGSTSAITSSAGVTTSAQVRLGRLLVMPTTFVGTTVSGAATERAVIVVDNFTANVTCDATRNGATAAAVSSWSAIMWYWTDESSNNLLDGSYKRTTLPLPGAGESTLAAIKTANPVVYDAATDVRLFGTSGYLGDWSNLAAGTTNVSADGRETSAAIPGALRIFANPTNTTVPGSGLTTSLGDLSCEAVDRR
jgi:type II secretory pathway pseudopilin PulG